jgi:hypothetical protein
MLIDVDGERFAITMRFGPDGRRIYDFLWLNGPSEPRYGFTIGATSPLSVFSQAELEEKADAFIQAFFSPSEIGSCDFPEFVASRGRL